MKNKRILKNLSAKLTVLGICSLMCIAGGVGVMVNNTNVASADESSTAFEMVDGASVRIADNHGIRFQAKMGTTLYNSIVNNVDGAKKVGMFVVPASYVNDASKYQNGESDLQQKAYQNFKQKIEFVFYDSSDVTVENKIYFNEDGYYMNGVVEKFYLSNFDLEYIAIGYIATINGQTGKVVYDFADFDIVDNGRSAAYVANAAYGDYTNSNILEMLENYVYGSYYETKGMQLSYSDNQQVFTYNGETYDSVGDIIAVEANEFSLTTNVEALNISALETAEIVASYMDKASVNTGIGSYAYFTSSDESVVKVDKNGMVYGLAEGTAEVVVRCLDASKTIQVSVADQREEVSDSYYFSINNPADVVMETDGTATSVIFDGTDITELVEISNGNVVIPQSVVGALSTGVHDV